MPVHLLDTHYTCRAISASAILGNSIERASHPFVPPYLLSVRPSSPTPRPFNMVIFTALTRKFNEMMCSGCLTGGYEQVKGARRSWWVAQTWLVHLITFECKKKHGRTSNQDVPFFCSNCCSHTYYRKKWKTVKLVAVIEYCRCCRFNSTGLCRFDKLVGGKCMGEVVRLVLEKLTRAGVLFSGKGSDALFEQDSFPTKYISEILR